MKGRASASSLVRRRARRVASPTAEWLEPKQLLAIFTVTSADDSGSGTLREAIQQANQTAEQDSIRFNITPQGTQTIALQSALPAITAPLTLDGTTQPGYDPSDPSPMIALDGSAAGDFADGLVFEVAAGAGASGTGSTVRGLAIGGFDGDGIILRGNGHLIQGNYIGLDPTGSLDRGNGAVGLELESSSRNTIGGTSPATRNVISGNALHGVRINALQSADATANRIIGNSIGTDASGTLAIANGAIGDGGDGINFFGGGGNTVGGPTAAERNVISGNRGHGIEFFGTSASRNTVIGNYIGTTADGSQALGNDDGGIFGLGNANTIGGTTPSVRNVISGNDGPGVSFQGGLTEGDEPVPNLVQGNYIGTDASGGNALGNVEAGVRLFTDDAIVGGAAPGAGNRIAHTRTDVFGRGAGVAIILSSKNNSILSNEIFSNSTLGIDFNQNDQVLPNDPDDADTSTDGVSNEGQNYPVIAEVSTGGGVTVIRGTLDSTPGTTFRLQFFANDQVDPSGFGEGRSFLGETTVQANAEGDAPFEVILPGQLSNSQYVSSTATDEAGNTSEFSRSVQVVPLPATDLTVSTSFSPNPATVGNAVTVSVTVTNAGPNLATGVELTDRLPVGAGFVSSADGFQPGDSGLLVAEVGSIPSGQSRTLTYVLRPGVVGTVSNDVRVSTAVIDLVPDNDAASADLIVEPEASQSVFAFAADAFNAVESDGSVRITVNRSNGDAPASVRYSIELGGSATAGSDYVDTSGVLQFAQGEFSRTFDITLYNDVAVEGPETVNLVLSEPGGDSVLALPFRATLTLLDDDPTAPPSGRFRLGAADFSAVETSPFVTVPVERVGGFEGEARVRIRTTPLSAVPGEDFEPIDFVLVFSDGDAAPKLIQIPLIDNAVYDPDRTFAVELSDPVNAPLAGPSLAVVTIVNDEPAPTPPEQQRFRFTASTFSADEDSGTVQVVIERDSPSGAASVVFRAEPGTAGTGRFVPVDMRVEFAEGETSKVVEVRLLDDDASQGPQTVLLSLTSPLGGPILGDPNAASLTILDDEIPPPPPPPVPGTIRFLGGPITVSEDAGQALVTLQRVGGSEGRITLYVVPMAGNAVPGADYDATPIPVVFEDGQTEVTISLPILDDSAIDGQKALGLFMTPPTGGASLDPIEAIVLLINDDERDLVAPTVTEMGFVGPARSPIGFSILFSEAIDPGRALDPASYTIVDTSGSGSVLAISDLSYNPDTRTVALVTASPLRLGRTYRVIVSGQGATAITDLGGNPLDPAGSVVDLSRGTQQQYRDANGDLVSLRIQGGGLLDVARPPGGDAQVVRVVPTQPGRKLVTGNVQRARGVGDGRTNIGRFEGVDPFGLVNVRLNLRQFAFGELDTSAVDAVLASSVPSTLRAARGATRR
ncbi:Calx-beta domain-containing protein [Tautonia plasticadhaerens]|uniref:Calx-beta domain protein n=1 Tax=Tautonia plasticadhaerens TaxID=2527974 RepID=A0A518GYG1_9BACT|nr:Calx-beta domain-containing protein [Tautonia plasticadhaerens]QDV33640.1 Calx-beta domain protein [Tautonia plasticadhaerens]